MQKWEYCQLWTWTETEKSTFITPEPKPLYYVISVKFSNGEKQSYKLKPPWESQRKINLRMEVFQKLGDQGWELVATDGHYSSKFFFKRPKT